MKKVCENSSSDINSSVYGFLLSYRSTPHSITLKSPAELLFNRKLKTRLSAMKPHISSIKDKEEKKLLSFNEISRNTRTFYTGDLVWVRNYQQRGDRWIKGTIIKQISLVVYLVQLETGHCVKKHVDQLRFQPVFESNNNEQHQGNTDIIENELTLPITPQTTNVYIPENTESIPQRNNTQYEIQTESNNPISSTNNEIKQHPHSQSIVMAPGRNESISERPKRIRRPPAYLKDYET